jgi:hypothetical protein
VMMSVMWWLNYLYMGHLVAGVYETPVKLYSLKPVFHVKNENSRNKAG